MRCCLGGADCWEGEFTYQRCCLSHPVLSSALASAAVGLAGPGDCGCIGAGAAAAPTGGFDWCQLRKAVMLNWDIGKLFSQFLTLDEATAAACPLGALQLLVSHAVAKLNAGMAPSELPSFVWVDEMGSLLFGSDRGPDALEHWVASGWNGFLMLSHLRGYLRQLPADSDEGPACGPDASTFLAASDAAIAGGPPVPLVDAAGFLGSLDGGDCEPEGKAPQPCCVPRALGLLALADASAVAGRDGERHVLLRAAGRALRAGLRSVGQLPGSPGALMALLRSRWPLVDFMDRLFQAPNIDLVVADTIRGFLDRQPVARLAGPDPQTGAPWSFRMRLFPQREIVSDMVRFSRTPFCGMRPFLLLVERVAAAAGAGDCVTKGASGDARCGLDFVEGGPHLGDCTLWASAALQSAGLAPFAAAYEPLPDASALFRESVLTNRWDGRVVVVPRALAARDGETVNLAYFPGHNGEGTTVRASEGLHCGENCAGYASIPTVTLDASWPALRPAPLEVLKLSVNGEELNVLRGARALLSKRQVCSVLVHVAKARRGWADFAQEATTGASAFSSEFWDLLTDTGGLEVSLHLDRDLTDQVHDDPRPRPSTRRIDSATELDDIFREPAFPHDYLVARQPPRSLAGWESPDRGEATAHCARSLALRHWAEVFG